jgi:hypothetical protein
MHSRRKRTIDELGQEEEAFEELGPRGESRAQRKKRRVANVAANNAVPPSARTGGPAPVVPPLPRTPRTAPAPLDPTAAFIAAARLAATYLGSEDDDALEVQEESEEDPRVEQLELVLDSSSAVPAIMDTYEFAK